MNITDSATLLVREIIKKTGSGMLDTIKITRVLAALYPDVPRSDVAELVDEVVEREYLDARRR